MQGCARKDHVRGQSLGMHNTQHRCAVSQTRGSSRCRVRAQPSRRAWRGCPTPCGRTCSGARRVVVCILSLSLNPKNCGRTCSGARRAAACIPLSSPPAWPLLHKSHPGAPAGFSQSPLHPALARQAGSDKAGAASTLAGWGHPHCRAVQILEAQAECYLVLTDIL